MAHALNRRGENAAFFLTRDKEFHAGPAVAAGGLPEDGGTVVGNRVSPQVFEGDFREFGFGKNEFEFFGFFDGGFVFGLEVRQTEGVVVKFDRGTFEYFFIIWSRVITLSVTPYTRAV